MNVKWRIAHENIAALTILLRRNLSNCAASKAYCSHWRVNKRKREARSTRNESIYIEFDNHHRQIVDLFVFFFRHVLNVQRVDVQINFAENIGCENMHSILFTGECAKGEVNFGEKQHSIHAIY